MVDRYPMRVYTMNRDHRVTGIYRSSSPWEELLRPEYHDTSSDPSLLDYTGRWVTGTGTLDREH